MDFLLEIYYWRLLAGAMRLQQPLNVVVVDDVFVGADVAVDEADC